MGCCQRRRTLPLWMFNRRPFHVVASWFFRPARIPRARTCDLLVFVVTRTLSGIDLTRRFRIGLVRPDNRRLSRERQAA
jgi:hypothetical protein